MSTRLWHPFANMADVVGRELVIESAKGVWLRTETGRCLLDATGSLWYANIGHGRQEVIDAIRDQLLTLDSYNIFNDYANRPALDLADRLAELAPVTDARVFLTPGGGDGIETAAKLARSYWSAVEQPERTHLIGRVSAFHGAGGFGTTIGGIAVNSDGLGPLVGDVSHVAYDSVEALAAEIDRLGRERVAAVFVEPVIGAGGVLPPPDGYIEAVGALCQETGVIFVLDEVICAFGRLGHWFAAERFGVEPDMIVFAKGVTSGYQPLGGVIISGRLAEPFWIGDGHYLRTGQTYSGHPPACAAALVNLAIIENENLLARSRELETILADALAPLTELPEIAAVRGLGLMAAVEISPDAIAAGMTSTALFTAARAAGVVVRPLGTSLGISPPLVMSDDEVDLIPEAIAAAVAELR